MPSPLLFIKKEVRLSYSESTPTAGWVEIQQWTDRQRFMNCAKLWGIFWLGAVVAVFLPVLHFFLVPLLFVIGPIAGIVKLQQKERIFKGEGICPACQAPLKIEPGSARFPLEELCGACRRNIAIEFA
ncbi:MAG: hypothetical protein U1F57_08035 [bacterium]